MSEQMTFCDSVFCTETRLKFKTVVKFLASCFLTSDFFLNFSRRRGHHLSVNAETRRTPCVVVVGPRPTTCRSPPAASVATLRSARESVSHRTFIDQTSLIFVQNVVCHFECVGGPKIGRRTCFGTGLV